MVDYANVFPDAYNLIVELWSYSIVCGERIMPSPCFHRPFLEHGRANFSGGITFSILGFVGLANVAGSGGKYVFDRM